MRTALEATHESAPADGALLDAFARGDADAFMAIYRRHARALYAYARALARDDAAAQDLVQEAFLALIDARAAQSVAGFLYAVVRNKSADAARRREVRGRTAPPPREAAADRRSEDVERAIASLPLEQREAVVLKLWSGLTFEEIGALTGVPPATATSRYRYAIGKLAEALHERE